MAFKKPLIKVSIFKKVKKMKDNLPQSAESVKSSFEKEQK